MGIFQTGDIVRGNNPWLNNMIGFYSEVGIVIEKGIHSSVIWLFISGLSITLLNDYIEKVYFVLKEKVLKVGDLVELEPKVQRAIAITGVGTIIEKTIIDTTDFMGEFIPPKIEAYTIFFQDSETEYTIPATCVRLFLNKKSK